MISKYFDDDWRASDCQEMCDHCKGNLQSTVQTYDIVSCLVEILKLVSLASSKETNLTLKKLLDCWFQTGPKNLQLSDSKPKFTKDEAEHIIAFLLYKKYLIVRRGYSLVTTLAYIDSNIEAPFNREKFGEISMNYAGVIRGVPIVINKSKSKLSRDSDLEAGCSKTDGPQKKRKKED